MAISELSGRSRLGAQAKASSPARGLPSWREALERLRGDLEAGRLYQVAGRWHLAPCPAPHGRCSCLPRTPRQRKRATAPATKRRHRAAVLIARALTGHLWATPKLRGLRRRWRTKEAFGVEVRRVVRERLAASAPERPSVRAMVMEFAQGLSPEAGEALLSGIPPEQLAPMYWSTIPASPAQAGRHQER